ncbi:MAG: BMP family ABC transporter substrate-binding protein [Acidimicrobiales bacterium]
MLLLAILAAFSLIAAACGDDDDDTSAGGDDGTSEPSDDGTEEPSDDGTSEPSDDGEEPMTDDGEEPMHMEFDANGDGEVVIGIGTAGPRDDGAYYEAAVNGAREFAESQGWSDIIVIDNIDPNESGTDLSNLAEQGVDIIIIASGESADAAPDLVQEYPDIFWYCRCGAGYPETPGLATSRDDSGAIEYAAGVATGILLEDSGGDSVYMLGGSAADFEVETELAFRLGLEAVNPEFTLTYVPTGAFPFDFDNVAGATEAFNVAVDAGADAIYPYLGGAHEPIIQLANEEGLITMSAGASDVCTRDSDLDWDLAIKFDGGDYIRAVFPLIVAGELDEGDQYVFQVDGPDSVAGVEICDATPEQQERLEELLAPLYAGELADQLFEIAAEAYGF